MKFRPYVSPNDLPAEAGSHRRPEAGSHGKDAGSRTWMSAGSGVSRKMRRATHEIELAPRSGYLISGSARRAFEHSIPPVTQLRYSITFRTLR
jgi:hypothetical protein